MEHRQVRYFREGDGQPVAAFKAGVCLHGHTLHSKEGVGFFNDLVRKSPVFGRLVKHQHRRRSQLPTLNDELKRIWWTPPLSAGQAFHLERRQIEHVLNKSAMVSITDHDDIRGALALQSVAANDVAPIAVEWTVPFAGTYFHLGIHNLPADRSKEIFTRLSGFSNDPTDDMRKALMAEMYSTPGVLVVFNHPLWDQTHMGADAHRKAVADFMAEQRNHLHAIEINGMRSWDENERVVRFADEAGMPLISGGDRHGTEPSAVLNLTNAETFSEFADEVRDGTSAVVVMPHYFEALKLRVTRTVNDVLSEQPDHIYGWTQWIDRTFRLEEDGEIRSFSELTGGKNPFVMKVCAGIVNLMANRGVRTATRWTNLRGVQQRTSRPV